MRNHQWTKMASLFALLRGRLRGMSATSLRASHDNLTCGAYMDCSSLNWRWAWLVTAPASVAPLMSMILSSPIPRCRLRLFQYAFIGLRYRWYVQHKFNNRCWFFNTWIHSEQWTYHTSEAESPPQISTIIKFASWKDTHKCVFVSSPFMCRQKLIGNAAAGHLGSYKRDSHILDIISAIK